jgi:hypothetical protein
VIITQLQLLGRAKENSSKTGSLIDWIFYDRVALESASGTLLMMMFIFFIAFDEEVGPSNTEYRTSLSLMMDSNDFLVRTEYVPIFGKSVNRM